MSGPGAGLQEGTGVPAASAGRAVAANNKSEPSKTFLILLPPKVARNPVDYPTLREPLRAREPSKRSQAQLLLQRYKARLGSRATAPKGRDATRRA